MDLADGKIYWSDYRTNGVANGDVRSAILDGSDPQVLVPGLNGSFALTLVPEPSALQLVGGGVAVVALICGRRRAHDTLWSVASPGGVRW
jgi:hypothetical protein